VAHAATWHLRGVPRGAISPAAPVVPDGGPATGTSEAAHPCLTGVGWNLAQSLRRYAAWGCELAVAGALATTALATMTQTLGAGGGGDETAEALLWLSIGAVLVVLVRPHDPLRRARSWRDAMAGFGCAVRRHGVVCAVAIPVLALGVFDEASVAAPQVAQQLLQLIPELVAVNLAGFSAAVLLLPSINGLLGTARGLARRRARYGKEAATEARVGWSDPRRRPAVARALTAAVTPPLSLILCVPGISAAAARGLEPAALVVAAGAAVALSLLAVAVAQESPGLARPRPWWLAVGAGATTGAAAGAGPELIAVGGLFGAAVGAGMEVGLHLARSVGVFWRHRHQLPLPPGDVVYRVDGREMEITLEATATTPSDEALARQEDGEVTDDGWRVSQLSGWCWEGTKGRAQLLGRCRADLLGVIHVLHPEAPGSPRR
jgi:hypothetical protein